MKVACHQANFIPWFPFFYKMAMADKFIILDCVQFEKNGFQNRYQIKDKWITKPVKHGMYPVWKKEYADGQNLLALNMQWIISIKNTLRINTRISYEHPCHRNGTFDNPTERLVACINNVKGNVYITNPDAKDKYLDEDYIRSRGIDIEYCKVPKYLQRHTFEILEQYGIDGAIKQLPKKESLVEVH